MGVRTGYTLTAEDLTSFSNQTKEAFIKDMLKEGIINEDQAEKMGSYSIVIAEKGFFGSIIDKFLFKNSKDSDMKITTVKIL